MSGRLMSSVIALGLEFTRQRKRCRTAAGNNRLQAAIVRQIDEDAGESQVVFDNEQDTVAAVDGVAIVVDRNVGSSTSATAAGLGRRRRQTQLHAVVFCRRDQLAGGSAAAHRCSHGPRRDAM